jgi:hypothetical protein
VLLGLLLAHCKISAILEHVKPTFEKFYADEYAPFLKMVFSIFFGFFIETLFIVQSNVAQGR